MRENLRFVSPRDRVLFLRSLSALEGVPTSGLMLIAEHMREAYFRRGDRIMEAGQPVEAAFFLVEGRVGLEREGEEVAQISAPAPIGFLGVVGGVDGLPGDMIARTNVTALVISRDALIHVWEEDFEVLYNSLRVAATRILKQRRGLPFDPDDPPPIELGEYPEDRLTLVDLLKLQRNMGPFRGANLETVAEISRQQQELRFAAGTHLWREGDPSSFMLRIHYGKVRVEQEGRDVPLFVGSNYTIGFNETLAQLPRSYSAVAETDVVVLRADIDPLLSVMEDHFDLAIAALQQLSRLAVQSLWRGGDFALLTR